MEHLVVLTAVMETIPRKAKTLPMIPTKNDKPRLPQPPPFTNVVRTLEDEPWGLIYIRGIIIAKNPSTCMIKISPSNIGRRLLITVFMKTATRMTAQSNSVPCQRLGSYCGLFSTIIPCMSVPLKYPPEATKACQPVAVSHPVRKLRNFRDDRGASSETQ